MKTTLAFAFLFVLIALPASAATSISVNTPVCYRADRVAKWSYARSGNTYNGVQDHTALLEVVFAEKQERNGGSSQSVVRLPIQSLHWDKNFHHVIYGDQKAVPVICAVSSRWGGQHRFTRDCDFQGRFVDARDPAAVGCTSRSAVEFEGNIEIRN